MGNIGPHSSHSPSSSESLKVRLLDFSATFFSGLIVPVLSAGFTRKVGFFGVHDSLNFLMWSIISVQSWVVGPLFGGVTRRGLVDTLMVGLILLSSSGGS